MRLALMLAPQRNALYSDLVRSLAPPELLASPLGPRIEAWDGVRLGGQDHLLVELDDEPATADLEALAPLGTVAASSSPSRSRSGGVSPPASGGSGVSSPTPSSCSSPWMKVPARSSVSSGWRSAPPPK